MLANLSQVLSIAEEKGIAVGGFNCATLESARAAISAAEEAGLPFVLQHAQVHEEYIPLDLAAPIMLSLAKNAKIPVCVHLDHGVDLEYVMRAIRLGFTSVMYDASGKSFDDNAKETALVVKLAHAVGASVEAELGNMPHNFKGELGEYKPEDFYTNPSDAKRFADITGVDALAISFGTVHGVYKATPKLNFDIVRQVKASTGNLPLVMHGGSGLSKEDYHTAIACGIRKINYYTYEALAGGRGIYEIVKEKPEGLQFHDASMKAISFMKDDVLQAIRLFSNTELEQRSK